MSVTTLSLSCAVFGHHVDNRRLTEEAGGHRCRCGSAYLVRARRLGDTRSPHPVLLSRQAHVPAAHRTRWLPRVRLRPGPPAGLPNNERSLSFNGRLSKEGPVLVRGVRTSSLAGDGPRRLRRARLPLRALVPQAGKPPGNDSAPDDLCPAGSLREVCDVPSRIRRVHVRELRASVLFCEGRMTPAGVLEL
jgi:hypothetical protein